VKQGDWKLIKYDVMDGQVRETQLFNLKDEHHETGLELSAITRIRRIYRTYGFRALAGEGGEPFGMDCFSNAFYATWRYRHREVLGTPHVTLAQLGKAEGLTERFVEHIWSIVTQPAPRYPISEVVEVWQALPAPDPGDKLSEEEIRLACDTVFSVIRQWHARLIRPTNNAEDSPVLNESLFDLAPKHSFTAPLTQQRVGGAGVVQQQSILPVRIIVAPGIPNQAAEPIVIWKNGRVRTRQSLREPGDEIPLRNVLSEEDLRQLELGVHPLGLPLGDNDFVMAMGDSITIHLALPENANRVELLVDVELPSRATDRAGGGDKSSDGIVRAEIVPVQSTTEEHTRRERSSSVILSQPGGNSAHLWREGIREFVAALPFVSHREAAPSDRDPIPEPFDNAYNMPERDWYHINVKYHRDDDFLFEKILDDPAREQLEEAWADLLTSFEHHDNYLKFTCEKFGIEQEDRGIAEADAAWIAELAQPARSIITRLRTEYIALSEELLEARPRHLENALELAERAWRRPLSDRDQERLLAYYEREFIVSKHDHSKAMRSLLARILVSPEFLYRAERPAAAQPAPISDWELASRLSYFLWSSVPDDELRSAAAAGILHEPDELERQVQRMLRHPHARRLATEFFGQWMGYYQFDRYAGVDHQVFPEFTEELRRDLLEEATRFFEHLIREDRPVHEILFADYGFLNGNLASHYQIPGQFEPDVWQRVDRLETVRRGGVLGLGAVLVANSGAPQRTSPVRRGDWILRRLLSTPVPPPPADAGSIPAAEVLGDGQTIRQRLEMHRNKPACMSCHSRIDPLGFALENFDSLGRWARDLSGWKTGGSLRDTDQWQGDLRLDWTPGPFARGVRTVRANHLHETIGLRDGPSGIDFRSAIDRGHARRTSSRCKVFQLDHKDCEKSPISVSPRA
jgi:hypothetical protein